MKVFINPGHDINIEPGAVNPRTGDREAVIALEAGKLLEKYLNAAGVQTKLLQDDNLGWVVSESDAWGADVFVSLHCNAFEYNKAKGTETWYKSVNGQRLADMIQSQIVRSVQTVDRGVKQGNFYVLRATDAVAVLVEMAFIDNDDDLQFLLKDNLDTIVRAIARGITDYQQG